jgi:hypothetical protein
VNLLSKISGFLILTGFPFFGLGQTNLVPNPSFEDFISCPTAQDQIDNCQDWYSPTTGSPDYFNECGSGAGGVPQNGFGWQYARTGTGYAGGEVGSFSGSNTREYIQTQLISTLEAGSHYEVSFWVSLGDSSLKACDHIGAYLSETAISLSDATNLPYVPQVVSQDGIMISDNSDWIEIVDTIVANGGENYITIGVFADDAEVNWIPVSGGWSAAPHYYYDDVSVNKVGTVGIENMISSGIDMLLQNDGLVLVKSTSTITNLELISATGAVVYALTNPSDNTKTLNLSEFQSGTYFLFVRNEFEHKKYLINNP